MLPSLTMLRDLLEPFLAALAVSAALSPAGVSGAFLLLPFQVSVLGLSGPAVTPTNHLYNVLAAPSGVVRYALDGRLAWPLAWVLTLAALPGAVAGAALRMQALAEPSRFRVLLAAVLLFFGARLTVAALGRRRRQVEAPADARVASALLTARRLEYDYGGQRYGASVPAVGALSAAVGVVGGAAGVGGGALIAPLLVSVFGLPVHSIAGATLAGNFGTSLASVVTFALLGGPEDLPRWQLGVTLGVGGIVGTWIGASLQRWIPERAVEVLLGFLTLGLAASYLLRA